MYSNGQILEDLDSFEEILEDCEYDENDESYESDENDLTERRRGRGQRPSPRTASGGLYSQPRPTQHVTQLQFQSALARVGAQIKTNSNAIKTVNSRVNTVSVEQNRQAGVLKKEIAERKKQDEIIKRDVRQKLELLVLLPLLLKPNTREIDIPALGDQPAEKVKVLVESKDNFSQLLPLLLLSGGLGGNGGLGGGTDSNSLLLILALSGGFNKK